MTTEAARERFANVRHFLGLSIAQNGAILVGSGAGLLAIALGDLSGWAGIALAACAACLLASFALALWSFFVRTPPVSDRRNLMFFAALAELGAGRDLVLKADVGEHALDVAEETISLARIAKLKFERASQAMKLLAPAAALALAAALLKAVGL